MYWFWIKGGGGFKLTFPLLGLRLVRNFCEHVKDLLIRGVRVSAEHSDETFNIFDGVILKGVAFLLLI